MSALPVTPHINLAVMFFFKNTWLAPSHSPPVSSDYHLYSPPASSDCHLYRGWLRLIPHLPAVVVICTEAGSVPFPACQQWLSFVPRLAPSHSPPASSHCHLYCPTASSHCHLYRGWLHMTAAGSISFPACQQW